MNNQLYYVNNHNYSSFLENQEKFFFQKYVDYIEKYSKNEKYFLDVGCCVGTVLGLIKNTKIKKIGIEISRTSLKICKSKKLNCRVYDGEKFPFNSDTFNVVGSINVLEHTDKPYNFLE